MSRTSSHEGSTRQLLEFCTGYFVTYVLTGILVKYFTGIRDPKLSELAYLVNNTLGGTLTALIAVFVLGWVRLKSNRSVTWSGLRFPVEFLYIIPSGICTAVVIPTTTLMYLLPISVMVAMVIMRGSIIVISRLVDSIQIHQGILKKKVYAEENWAVVFAILAVGINVALVPIVNALKARNIDLAPHLGLSAKDLAGTFDFMGSPAALSIMVAYITAYAIRIYIMNYFKNTRAPGVAQDNKGFFAIEQIAASATMILGGTILFVGPKLFGWSSPVLADYHAAAARPDPAAILSGIPFGVAAFFSVFLFMFKGRTATFAGLVNRLTSLLAGTTSTLLLAWFFHLKPPKPQDWVSFVFILVAVWFLARAEKRRALELNRS